jgi:mevalonate kinase
MEQPSYISTVHLTGSMISVSSPAKAILFGEHAVVFGKPAIAVALNRRMTLHAEDSTSFSVDGGGLRQRRHRYVRWGVSNLWEGPPMKFSIRSSIPTASGLGSSAALSCSLAALLLYRSNGRFPEERKIAENSFEIEFNTQGGASPTDTSCSAHGGGIKVTFAEEDRLLWNIEKEEKMWYVHQLDPPDITLVVGYTRKPSITPIQVGKVRSFYDRSGFARETIDEIGDLVDDGEKALRNGDLVEIGNLMNRNHSLLTILGVNSKELQKLKDGADRFSFGSKLTGAGGGGSIIALTEHPEKVSGVIRSRGGIPYVVGITREGTRLETAR